MIRVTVFKPADRSRYYAKWTNPETGSECRRTTGKTNRREAERFAADLETELNLGRDAAAAVSWPVFFDRYKAEQLTGLSNRTEEKARSVLGQLADFGELKSLDQITAALLSRWAAHLRKLKRAEDTIAGYLAYISAALTWAEGQRMITAVPTFPKIQRKKKGGSKSPMKGRPITAEEFDRLLAAIPAVISKKLLDTWESLIRGLWLSGLRLDEALNLHWTDETKMVPLIDVRRPMLQIPASEEKGNTDRLTPMSPEFAEFLRAIPEDDRTGYVFNPRLPRQRRLRLDMDRASKKIVEIGKAAGIVANRSGGKTKYASAHDLRRSFGARWSLKVMPAVLQQLMRHENINTTMRFYVGHQAESVADALWEAHETDAGTISGITLPEDSGGGKS